MKVIAGDSVSKDSEIVVKQNNEVKFVNIEDLFIKTEKNILDKKYYFPENLDTLSIDENGKVDWYRIKYIMKHKTNKKMYNIQATNQWSVKTTEDHSLIGYINKNRKLKNEKWFINVKPTEIGKRIKTILSLKYIPRKIIKSKNYPKELYQFMGLFIGNGSFNIKRSNNKNYMLSLSSGDILEQVEKVITPLTEMGYVDKCYYSKNGFDIKIKGKIIEIMEDFRDDRKKIVPKWLRLETEKNISYFISGIYESDGSISKRGNTYIITFTSIRKDFIKDVQKLLWFIGIPSGICKENNTNKYLGKDSGTYSIRLNIRENYLFKQKIKFITNRKQTRLDKVEISKRKTVVIGKDFDTVNGLKVKEIEYNDYVYDIEVEKIHNFFANGILVHNTDSIFVDLNEQNFFKLMKKSRVLEKEINESFDDFVGQFGLKKHFFSIKLEKICKTILFVPKKGTGVAKKRYAYLPYWIEGKSDTEIVYSGFQNKRCDSSKLAKSFQRFVIKQILEEKSSTVIPLTKMVRKGIINGDIKPIEYSIPSGYGRNLKEYKSVPIGIRAAEFSNLNYGTHLQKGDRFLWCYTKGKSDVVAFKDEFPDVEVNKEEMLRRTLSGTLENIFKAIGLDYFKHCPNKITQKNTLLNYVIK